MAIKTVGVVGGGQMGRGIAQVSAASGYAVVLREVSQELLDKALDNISQSLGRALHKERISQADHDATLERITGGVDLDVMVDCDLVIEAIVENLDAKIDLFKALDEIVDDSCLFSSNTSSLTLTQMAAQTARPDRFLGLHFFNPVPAMGLVEVVSTILTSEETLAQGRAYVEKLGKTPITCTDKSGFIVNRLLVPYLLDAVRALENGVGSIEDIDTGMKLGCGHPMGPFTLMDFIGLDTMYFIANVMFEEYRETRFAPPPLLTQKVQAGHLGRKSGRGFYAYEA
jgi:3-hydroxybutyryl-CoA dehydrogenase